MTKSFRLYSSLLFAAALALLFLTAARAEESTTTIKFSDLTKPGTLKIILAHGDLRIRGTDATEIAVTSESKAVTQSPRKDGLRVITASSGFSLTEKSNTVVLDALSDGWAGGSSDFRVVVPRATNIIVANSYGGDIDCTGVAGDFEIKSMNGEVKLADLAGGVVVETMNGEISASVRELKEGKPLSFTSTNGEVVIRLPAATKANVRLRTQNGSILTDFDEKALVTKTESAPRGGKGPSKSKTVTLHSGGAITDETRAAINEAAHESAAAIREAAQAIKEAAQAAREGASEAGIVVPPVPPMPPMPPIPSASGGKLVTGTLNGGGPEISVTTMNGDVTLRQLETKK